MKRNVQMKKKKHPPPVKSRVKQEHNALWSYFPFRHVRLSLVSDQTHHVQIPKVFGWSKCIWVAHKRAWKPGRIAARVTNFCFQWLYYSAATTFWSTSLDVVQKHICEWKGMTLSATRESGSKTEVLWADTDPTGLQPGLCRLGKGGVVMHCKNPSTNQDPSMRCVVSTSGKNLPCHSLWCEAPAEETCLCTTSTRLCMIWGTNTCSGGIWSLFLG